VFELPQPRALQQALVLLDRPSDLPLLAIQIPENQMDFEWIAGHFGGCAQFFDRGVDLVRDQEVESEHVVRRFAGAAAVDPPSVLELVPFPGFADGEPRQQRKQHEERGEGAHQTAGPARASGPP